MVGTLPFSVPRDWLLLLPNVIEQTLKIYQTLELYACLAHSVDYILCFCDICTFHYFYCMLAAQRTWI